MAKTGESHTTARRQRLDTTPALQEQASGDAVERPPERPRKDWFALLDE